MRSVGVAMRGGRAYRILLAVMLSVQSIQATHAPYHSPMAYEYGAKPDLASILQDPPIQQHERMSEALQIIHPIQSGPRCHYHATLNLLNDCKFLESASTDGGDDSESALNQYETVYAARLAVCELMSANAFIPPDCKVVTPTREACVKKRRGYGSWFATQEELKEDKLCYPEAPDTKQFKRCMKAIFAQNQAWMSYSNARQNAVVMCHASRDVIEKEKNLSFYKNLGEAVNLMATVLAQYNGQIKNWLSEHDALVERMRASSEQVLQDMQDGISTFDTIKSAFRSFAGMMAGAAESYVQEMNESLEKSKASMQEHRQEIREYHQELAETSLQHASAQRSQLQFNHDAAVAALQSYHSAALETLHSNHEVAIAKVIELSGTVDTLQVKVEMSSHNLDHINLGLVNVNRTVERLDAATENLPEVLHILTTFGGIITSPHTLLAAVVCLIGLWKASGKVAGYFIATIGLSYLIHRNNISNYFTTFREHVQSNVAASAFISRHPLGLVIFSFGVICTISFLIYTRIRSTSLYRYRDDKGEEGVLPSIEAPGHPVTPRRHHGRSHLLRYLHLALS